MLFSLPIVDCRTPSERKVDIIHVNIPDEHVTDTPDPDGIYLAPLSNTKYIPMQKIDPGVRQRLFFDKTQCYWINGRCHYGSYHDICRREKKSILNIRLKHRPPVLK